MKLLLDESLPRQLAAEFPASCQVFTVPQMGWASFKNGVLLRLATEANFDAFITPDRNLERQQNLSDLKIRIVVVMAVRNRLPELIPLVASIVQAIQTMTAGEVAHVGA